MTDKHFWDFTRDFFKMDNVETTIGHSSSVSRACSKCGGSSISIRWTHAVHPVKEHMKCSCQVCGYAWTEDTKDAVK